MFFLKRTRSINAKRWMLTLFPVITAIVIPALVYAQEDSIPYNKQYAPPPPPSKRFTMVEYIPNQPKEDESVYTSIIICPPTSQLKFRVAAYIPSNKRFKDIYGRAGIAYEIEGATRLKNNAMAWLNFNWLTRNGRAHGPGNCTRINIANASFGLNFYTYLTCSLTAYLGIGPNISTVWITERSFCGVERTARVCLGGVLKSGIQYTFCDYYLIELFADYLYQPVKFDKRRTVSGLKIGAGLGVRF